MLGNLCQYKCSYCNSNYYGGDKSFPSLETALSLVSVYPKCDLLFTGGEPTIWKDLEDFLKSKPADVRIRLQTNGAKPISYWERIEPFLHNVILSFHSEYSKVEKFVEFYKLLGKKVFRVNLPMTLDKWDYCVSVYEELSSISIPVSPKVVLKGFGLKTEGPVDYSKEQWAWINNHQDKTNTVKIVFEDNSEIFSSPSKQLAILEGTNFSGLNCYSPVEQLTIDADGSMYSSSCSQRKLLGNVNNLSSYTREFKTMVCSTSYCWCYSDIHTTKTNDTR